MSPKFPIGSFFFPIGLRRDIRVGAKGCLMVNYIDYYANISLHVNDTCKLTLPACCPYDVHPWARRAWYHDMKEGSNGRRVK
jgi:hypothetical protein